MLARGLIRICPWQETAVGSLRRGLIVVFASAALIIGLEGSDLGARSIIESSAETVVNRALKGDRLVSSRILPPATHRRGEAPGVKLPYGCEPAVSSIVSRELAHIASRCVS